MPSHEDLKEVQEFRKTELKKYFKMGDHVLVLAGIYEKKTGVIIRVDPNRVIVISDIGCRVLEVLPRDLQLYNEMATGLNSLGRFKLGDLINFDNGSVGVIVRLEKDCFHVLDINGNVVEKASQALSTKRETRFAAALDANKNQIEKKDMVKVLKGPQSGKLFKIKYIYRNNAFVYCPTSLENGGFLVFKTYNLELLGGKKVSDNVAMPTTANLSAGSLSPSISSLQHPSRRRCDFGGGRDRGGGGGQVRRLRYLGKQMKVIKGTYKGYQGQIYDEKDTCVRMQLNNDTMVWISKVHLGDITKGIKGANELRRCTTFYPSGRQTPQYGNKTPMYAGGAQTPYYQGNSPNPYERAQTPTQSSAWNPNIPNSPPQPSSLCETLPFVEDSPATPKINNNVLVIAGELKGKEGRLIAIEGEEGIVNIYKVNEIVMIKLEYLCLMA